MNASRVIGYAAATIIRGGVRLGNFGILGLVSGVVACTYRVDNDPLVRETEGNLAVYDWVTLWPEGNVPVCFKNGDPCERYCSDNFTQCDEDNDCPHISGDSGPRLPCNTAKTCGQDPTECDADPSVCQLSNAAYEADKANVFPVLEDTWGAASSLEFSNHDDCGGNTTGKMVIKLQPHPTWGGACGAGLGAHCYFGAGPFNPRVLVHEVGHGLGLIHEHSRPESQGLVCAGPMEMAAGCTACTSGGCSRTNLSSCTCTASEFNACFAERPDVSGNQTLTLADYDAAVARIANNGPRADAHPVTAAYDPDSVMNYCSTNTGYSLTALDKLGIEILYPLVSEVLPVGCGDGCFLSDAGVILRTDGSARDSWSSRGANPWWGGPYQGPLIWEHVNSGHIGSGALLSAGDLAEGVHQIQYSGNTKYSLAAVTGEGQVVVGNDRWTALAMAAL